MEVEAVPAVQFISHLPTATGAPQRDSTKLLHMGCPGFSWDRVNFLASICCVLDLVQEEY